jgi:hydrogenase/urease accessory protein HupE
VLAASLVSLLASLLVSVALAHGPESAAYSKFEATTSDRTIAVVFAFHTPAMLRELQREAPVRIDRSNLDGFGDSFAPYLFSHFTISNDGQTCQHPPTLGGFFWDATSDHVIAVTKFECDSPLDDLVIRSVVTRDMPLRHDTVGDLRHGRALVRHFFSPSDVEERVQLSSLPQRAGWVDPGGDAGTRANAWIPEQERLYEALAAKTLNIDLPASLPTDVNPFATLVHFLREGILHIFTGYDHVAFIVTLMLAVKSWRELGLLVTSFTAAHSVTLALATLGIVTLPPRFVEPLIALSVLIVAVDAIVRPHGKARMSMAFGFGLVHGLGLSNVLRDLGLSGRELLPALLGFNVGVELGQLAIVAPMFVLVQRVRQREAAFTRSRNVMCAAVAVAATIWFLTRVRAALLA